MSTMNPDVGTWKLNAAQSKYSPDYPMQLKQATLVVIHSRINKGTLRSTKRRQVGPDQFGVGLHFPKDPR